MSDAGRDNVTQAACPYVGPRPYVEAQCDLFYGRAADTTRFLNQVLADRLVLLHSPSGAGKTSLVNASLTPKLRKRGFTIWGRLRVKRPERRGSSAHGSVTVQPPFAGLTELQGGATLGTSWTRSLPFANLLLVSPR